MRDSVAIRYAVCAVVCSLLHRESKNETLYRGLLLPIASPNIDRFSEFFHLQTQEAICNKAIVKDSTTPQMRRYTTL